MRAMLCRELGDVANLSMGELPDPRPGPGEACIRVRAAGVNFPDILMAEGKYQVRPPLLFVPGLEVAGEVESCGDGVQHVKPGDRVMAFARSGGGYAERIVLPGAIVTPIPDAMDFVTAAAFPTVYGTAHFALTHRGRLRAGETLLVLGAGGGVGLAAVEVGHALGARVIAAARGDDKLAAAREHGAEDAVDYASQDLRDAVLAMTDGRGVDAVFDPVGGDVFRQAVRCAGWEGRVLIVGFASGDIPKVAANYVLIKNLSIVGVVFGEHSERFPDETRERLAELAGWFADGRLKPRIHRVFPLADAHAALAEIRERRVIGKVVLEV